MALQTDKANAVATRLANGVWGGRQVQLTITEAGGRLSLGCAEGSFDGPVRLDRHGKFAARGTFDEQAGGPQHADETFKPSKARFSGQVSGETMDLSVLPAGTRTPQTFHLRKGVRAKIIRCL